MKRLISVLVSVILIFGNASSGFCLFAPDETIKFSVASDLHIDCSKTKLSVNYPESELYFQAGGSGNLYDQAVSLTKQFLNNSAEEDVDFVLISGDLTRSGTEKEHKFTASLLSEFTQESGIPVYVVPGNHDYFNSNPDDFKKYYADCGYNTAIAVDDNTASYVVDIGDTYRLIAVDSNDPGKDSDGIDKELISWIDSQVKLADEDGKRIIYSMHHPLLEHLYLGSILMSDFIVRNSYNMAEQFCEWGIKYVFSGHEHGNDIAEHKSINGNTVYDIVTTSLSAYPLEYRMVTFSNEGVNINMRSIDECDIDSLITGYTSAQIAKLSDDYNEYAYGLFTYSIEKKILRYTSPEFIIDKLDIDENDTKVINALNILFTAVNEALNMPLYDTGDGSVSIESLAAEKGVTIPESDYTSLVNLASALVASHYHGDEDRPSSRCPDAEILIKGLNTGLEYILTACGEDDIVTEVDLTQLSPWFTLLNIGKEQSYQGAEAVLDPILDKFTVDFGPNDRDIELPPVELNESSPNIIAGFFNKIFAFIKNIIADFVSKFN